MARPKSLASVASTGSTLDVLVALRDYLAKALDECDSDRDRASLTARFREVVLNIDELRPPTEEVDPLADLVPAD